MKAGSILAIKQHAGAESIMQAIHNDIVLEVFLDLNDEAQGYLYIDDGETYRNAEYDERLYLEFTFEKGTLYYKNLLKSSRYEECKVSIKDVIIYGVNDLNPPQ